MTERTTTIKYTVGSPDPTPRGPHYQEARRYAAILSANVAAHISFYYPVEMVPSKKRPGTYVWLAPIEAEPEITRYLYTLRTLIAAQSAAMKAEKDTNHVEA